MAKKTRDINSAAKQRYFRGRKRCLTVESTLFVPFFAALRRPVAKREIIFTTAGDRGNKNKRKKALTGRWVTRRFICQSGARKDYVTGEEAGELVLLKISSIFLACSSQYTIQQIEFNFVSFYERTFRLITSLSRQTVARLSLYSPFFSFPPSPTHFRTPLG